VTVDYFFLGSEAIFYSGGNVAATRLRGITFQQTRLFCDENITGVYVVPYSATLVQDLCRDFFKILNVLSLQSLYINVLLFLVNVEDSTK